MFRQLLFALVILRTSNYISAESKIKALTTLKYQCDIVDKKIIIPLKQVNDISANIRVLTPDQDPKSFHKDHNTTHMSITYALDKSVIVVVNPVTLTDTNIAGGQNRKLFSLNCSSTFVAKKIYLAQKLSVSDGNSDSSEAEKYLPIQISLTSNKTNPVIGEPIALTLSTTETHVYLKPILCKAQNTKSSPSKEVDIWNVSNNPHNKDNVNIIKENWKSTNKSSPSLGNKLTIDVYAFRFVDSHDLYIMCNVKICKTGASHENDCNISSTAKKRKRRNSENTVLELTATSKLRVFDLPYRRISSSGSSPTLGSLVVPAMLLIIYSWTTQV